MNGGVATGRVVPPRGLVDEGQVPCGGVQRPGRCAPRGGVNVPRAEAVSRGIVFVTFLCPPARLARQRGPLAAGLVVHARAVPYPVFTRVFSALLPGLCFVCVAVGVANPLPRRRHQPRIGDPFKLIQNLTSGADLAPPRAYCRVNGGGICVVKQPGLRRLPLVLYRRCAQRCSRKRLKRGDHAVPVHPLKAPGSGRGNDGSGRYESLTLRRPGVVPVTVAACFMSRLCV
mmetsp:Transcript_37812/g.94011  ORF Transcript_37812/g.94011 Transcript_37812/m.94011 type:complete len:230 (-) Transcript_37812:1175-1864(-)